MRIVYIFTVAFFLKIEYSEEKAVSCRKNTGGELMKRTAKKISAAVALLLIAAFALCAVFVVAEADHTCTDTGCSICAGIASCLNVLSTEACKAGASAGAQLAAFAAVLVLGAVAGRAFSTSLVTLKIKLSD